MTQAPSAHLAKPQQTATAGPGETRFFPEPRYTPELTLILDERFFAHALDHLERWLQRNTPSVELRRTLLRASQTLFAGWGDTQE